MTPEQFFIAERSRPLDWSVTDCCHTVDRWLRLRSGRSFFEADGRDYKTADEAQALMAEVSLPLLVSRAMRKAGIPMTRNPLPGDIGMIVLPKMIVCAVRGERMWLYRSDDGIGAAPLDSRVVGAWRVE